MAVKKLAVLGGGMGSLTAVLKLTEKPDWKEQYDITIYQMGWRLGGKGASGRNAAIGQRIEEHGLHLWFGFYDNAFDLIKGCYAENNRPPDAPLSTWQEAFKGYDTICLEEQDGDGWQHWPFTLPSNNQLPGYGTPHDPEEWIFKLLEHLMQVHHDYHPRKTAVVQAAVTAHYHSPFMTAIRDLVQPLIKEAEHSFADAGEYLLYAAKKIAQQAGREMHGLIKTILAKFKHWLETISAGLLHQDPDLKRFVVMSDMGVVMIIGMIEDQVLNRGFNSINKYDFRDWLVQHGAFDITVNSAVVQAVYGLVFGGKNQYTFEAGSALRGLLRMGLTYRGHVYYRMMAGMGDAIFGPIYEVLIKRGVRIEFFHKVTSLNLSADGLTVASVDIDIQATLTDPEVMYNPLITVNGLPCWPTEPDYAVLQQGENLKAQQVNLESYYSTWKAVGQKKLIAGSDYDQLILGISIGALPAIAPQLIAKSDRWKAMIEHVVPISTIAYQLWLQSSIGKMEWPFAAKGLALLGSYQEPYDTWADMSDLIEREAWPETSTPKNIAYFCGPTPAEYAEVIQNNARKAEFNDSSFPETQRDVARQYALDYLQQLAPHIWPGIAPGSDRFDFSQLTDPSGGEGKDRFDQQFFRANIDPTELYVMSFTDSTRYRLKTDDNDFSNLYITGDWIECGLNAGCIEATVIAGLRTARAISGENFEIPGEND